MKYFEDVSVPGNGPNGGTVFGYDPNTQQSLIDAAKAKGWTDISSHWPPSLTLAGAQSEQINQLRSDCSSEIIGGFSSSALGSAHTYPSKDTDQTNLIGAVTASQSPNLPTGWTINFWCADSSGVWALRPHTAAQIQQVLADGVTARSACSAQLDNLTQQVISATTITAVQAITWTPAV